jgi:hypothetical protein
MDVIFVDYTLLLSNLLVIPTIFLTIIVCIFGVIIANFFGFHLQLVSSNKTTIDTLEVRRSGNAQSTPNNLFDIG